MYARRCTLLFIALIWCLWGSDHGAKALRDAGVIRTVPHEERYEKRGGDDKSCVGTLHQRQGVVKVQGARGVQLNWKEDSISPADILMNLAPSPGKSIILVAEVAVGGISPAFTSVPRGNGRRGNGRNLLQQGALSQVEAACGRQCASLSGQVADRCALWHQVVRGLGYREGPFRMGCQEFVTAVDVCSRSLEVPFNATCDNEDRVKIWNGTLFKGSPFDVVGSLSPAVGVMDHLQVLDLSGVGIPGTLPPAWGSLTRLTRLYIDSNRLVGPLPVTWSSLVNLEDLQLHNNSLDSTLPPEWGNLTRLTRLYIHANRLVGLLPVTWSSLVNLEDLQLYNNSLDGTLPPEWGSLTRLTALYIGTNRLVGPLPVTWSSLVNLTDLHLYNNNLDSSIPSSWSNMAQLSIFLLSGNARVEDELSPGLMALPDSPYMPGTCSGLLLPNEVQPVWGMRALFRYINATGTSITLPSFMDIHIACQRIQRRQGLLLISYGDDVFWCGKTWHAEVQVAILWGTFAVAMVVVVVGRRRWWRPRVRSTRHILSRATATADISADISAMGKAETSTMGRTSLLLLLKALWVRHLHIHLRVALGLVDLASDILLAVSMYPSWTSYVVMVGFFLPDLVCSFTLALGCRGTVRHRGVPSWAVYPLAALVFVTMMGSLPVVLLITSVLTWVLQRRGVKGPWSIVHVDRVLGLYSGVTACTEDLFTSVFSSVGLILMNQDPIKTVITRIYFPVWIFWISVPFSMVHMLMEWWQAVGHCLEHGDLSWVPVAFRGLYCDEHHGTASPVSVVQLGVKVEGGDGADDRTTAATPREDHGGMPGQAPIRSLEDDEEFQAYLNGCLENTTNSPSRSEGG